MKCQLLLLVLSEWILRHILIAWREFRYLRGVVIQIYLSEVFGIISKTDDLVRKYTVHRFLIYRIAYKVFEAVYIWNKYVLRSLYRNQ